MLVIVVALSIRECACAAIAASRGTVAEGANVRVGGGHREACCGIARVYDRRRRRHRLNYYGYISARTFHSWRTMLGS